MSEFSQPLESLITNREEGEELDEKAIQALRENIQSMIEERTAAKLERDYDLADSIREDLRNTYGIEVRDREREWSIGGVFVPPPEPYQMSKYSVEPTTISPEEVDAMVQERVEARAERAYDVADDIKYTLLEDHNIVIEDDLRRWSVNGDFGKEEIEEDLRSYDDGPRPTTYTRRGGGDLSDEELELVDKLLAERTDMKRARDFLAADSIRERLMADFQIRVDDRSMEWHVVSDDYCQVPTNHDLDAETVAFIQDQVNQRCQAKYLKEFAKADDIRDSLMDEFSVAIDDRVKGVLSVFVLSVWKCICCDQYLIFTSSIRMDGCWKPSKYYPRLQ